MKGLIVVLALVAAGYFGFHYRAGKRAEEALIASVCAEEITAEVMGNVGATVKDGASVVTGASLALQRKALYEGSSLAPHLKALRHMGDPSIPTIKELAVAASARCPDVFPEPIKAEKPIGYVWMMALDMPE